MVYGYVRVSTDRQDCENQKIGIISKSEKLGLNIDKYIYDTGISGVCEPEKRALGGCLKRLKRGDIIICSELSRLGRKLFMIMRILEHCMKCGARLYTVKEGYELGDNIQSKCMAFAFGLSAEIERNLISLRTKEALEKRRANGVVLGRPRGVRNKNHKLDDFEEILKTQLAIGTSKNKISKMINTSVPTINKWIEYTKYLS